MMTLQEIVEQLESCSFECEAGPIHNNVAFIELKRLAGEADERTRQSKRLYEAVKNWRYGLIDKQLGDDIGSIACTFPAIYRLASTFDEVERTLNER